MAYNNSSVGGRVVHQQSIHRVIVVQLLVIIFLSVNCLLFVTFLRKDCFYTTTRYILFAVTLLSDSLILFVSDILLIFTYFGVVLPVWLCVIISVAVLLYMTVTPVTLTAMTLERYVAICMPLRHGELCSRSSTVFCILIIHGVSSVPCIVVLSTFFASVPLSFHKESNLCSVEVFIVYRWQEHMRSTMYQFFFLILCIVIFFSYVKIMKVAKNASGENKNSTWKALKTVMLHTFQQLLCLIQLWCPLIEAAMLQINPRIFIEVRYMNYILFCLTPRCLSPLIYGLRDELFFHALKNYVFCGVDKRNI